MSIGETTVIQITNIAPSATKEQMSTLFGFLGHIKEIQLFPADDTIHVSSRVCYIRYAEPSCVGVAQHLTNTVFVDRALIVLPVASGKIPDEASAMTLTHSGIGGINSGVVSQMVTGAGGAQMITTIDPKLTALNLTQYPPLPANMDPTKIEEIRRTVYVGNLDSNFAAEQLLKFFNNQIGEVKYIRMAGDENQPTRFAFVEFTDQSSVANALQYNGVVFGGRPIKINHSNNAIVKPQLKNETAQKEIEEAMKRVREAQSLISAAIEPGYFDKMIETTEKKKSPSRSRSRSRKRSRSRSRRSRSRGRKSRSRERTRKSRSHSRERTRRSRSPRRRSKSRERRRSKSRERRLRSRSRSRDRRHRRRSKSKERERKRRSRSRERRRRHSRSSSRSRSKRNDREKSKERERDRQDKTEKDKEKKDKIEIASNNSSQPEGPQLPPETFVETNFGLTESESKEREAKVSPMKYKEPSSSPKTSASPRSKRVRSPKRSRSRERTSSRSHRKKRSERERSRSKERHSKEKKKKRKDRDDSKERTKREGSWIDDEKASDSNGDKVKQMSISPEEN